MSQSLWNPAWTPRLSARIHLGSLLVLASFAAVTPAYDCTIGVYSNPTAAPSSDYEWPPFELHDLYVVLHAESTAGGAAYSLVTTHNFQLIPVSYGPAGDGIHIEDIYDQEWVGFGQCAIGFGGEPVLIAHMQAFINGHLPVSYVRPAANFHEHVSQPVYADCANQIFPCASHPFVFMTVGTSETSFGGIKALYAD